MKLAFIGTITLVLFIGSISNVSGRIPDIDSLENDGDYYYEYVEPDEEYDSATLDQFEEEYGLAKDVAWGELEDNEEDYYYVHEDQSGYKFMYHGGQDVYGDGYGYVAVDETDVDGDGEDYEYFDENGILIDDANIYGECKLFDIFNKHIALTRIDYHLTFNDSSFLCERNFFVSREMRWVSWAYLLSDLERGAA